MSDLARRMVREGRKLLPKNRSLKQRLRLHVFNFNVLQ